MKGLGEILGIPPPGEDVVDFACIGAGNLRLIPWDGNCFELSDFLRIISSCAEANPAAGLSFCFRKKTKFFTAYPDTMIGRRGPKNWRDKGVEVVVKWVKSDGARGPVIPLVFSEMQFGCRQPSVEYQRAGEATEHLQVGDFNYAKHFQNGVRWGHSGGLFAALFPHSAGLIIELFKEVRKRGGGTSYDINLRPALWKGATWSTAVETNCRIIREGGVQFLVGNEEDFGAGLLGIKSEKVAKGEALDPREYIEMFRKVAEMFPELKVIATSLREVHSSSRHKWRAMMWVEGKVYVIVPQELINLAASAKEKQDQPQAITASESAAKEELSWTSDDVIPVGVKTDEFEVIDRIGGGDSYFAGLAAGALENMDPPTALRIGWSHGAQMLTFVDDSSQSRRKEVEALAGSGSLRVQR